MRFAALWVLAGALSGADLVKEGDRWWSHIKVLAGDKMQGRNTGSAGHKRAAQYMASEFERAGLKPAGSDGYFQPVKFKVAQIMEEQSSLSIVNSASTAHEQPLRLGEDATLGVRPGVADHVDAEAVFCGYALQIPEYKFDDFAALDLKDKICVYVAGGPSEIPNNLRSHYSFREERWKALHQAGVIGLVAIQNPKSMDIPWERSTLTRLNATMALADERFSDTPGQQFAATFNALRAQKLFSESGHTMAELLALADGGKPLPRFPLNVRLRANVRFKLTEIESQNVIGVLPGSDPKLKDEYVVFGGHLDHLGIGAGLTGDRIYNGAMDDGSGMASLLEIATLARQERLQFKRSVLFVAVTGEEKGLLGSRYFNANATVPIRNVVADINMDMYLPLYPLRLLEVQGVEESSLGADVRAAAAEDGVTVLPDQQPERNLFIRSDQYNFIRQGVPALAFKFGFERGSAEEQLAQAWVKNRYHSPSDDLNQPVDKAAAAKYNRIMLKLGQRVANADAHPTWNANSFFKRFVKAN
jgi:hypothetical protein